MVPPPKSSVLAGVCLKAGPDWDWKEVVVAKAAPRSREWVWGPGTGQEKKPTELVVL